MQQAEKFGRPIVCLVDTQGAFCGMEAEERGQGNAIADNLLLRQALPFLLYVLFWAKAAGRRIGACHG